MKLIYIIIMLIIMIFVASKYDERFYRIPCILDDIGVSSNIQLISSHSFMKNPCYYVFKIKKEDFEKNPKFLQENGFDYFFEPFLDSKIIDRVYCVPFELDEISNEKGVLITSKQKKRVRYTVFYNQETELFYVCCFYNN